MTQARQRHARFYLEYARANPEDWQWFDAEWLQIKRAWDNVCEDDALVLDYIETITDFMQIRGILQEVIEWTQRGLDAARVGKEKKDRSPSIQRNRRMLSKVRKTSPGIRSVRESASHLSQSR